VDGWSGWLIYVGVKTANDIQLFGLRDFLPLNHLLAGDMVAMALKFGSALLVDENQIDYTFSQSILMAQQQPTAFIGI
jgi:hypothetical protein